jgi:hypothetical protein
MQQEDQKHLDTTNALLTNSSIAKTLTPMQQNCRYLMGGVVRDLSKPTTTSPDEKNK